jgi:hypothetical protein
VTVKAWLEGDNVDLQRLASLFAVGSFCIRREGDGRYYLSCPELDSRPDGVSRLQVAGEPLAVANGIARTLNPDHYRPVRLQGSFSAAAKPNVAEKELSIEIRDPAASAVTAGPPPDGPAYFQLVSQSADMREAIAIIGRPPAELSYFWLYKVMEIIENAGAIEAARLAAGVSKASIKLFYRTANHQAASGPNSRHARSNKQPPAKPMPIQEAQTMIARILAAWILLAQPPGQAAQESASGSAGSSS